MGDDLVVLCACATPDEAESIAQQLVERVLAACVQVLPPIQSVYWWQGKVERKTEHLLIIKTNQRKWDELEREIRKAHSYEVPEILALPVQTGSEPYVRWLRSTLA